MFQDHSLILILQQMDIKSIFQSITVCRFWRESIENYMKRPDIETNLIDCGKNMELGIKLAERGFKVKLDMSCNHDLDYTDDLMKALGKMYDLNLSGNHEVIWDKHLPFLSGVHTLNISYCYDTITDVSVLKDVFNLDISYCNGISDISGLGEGKIHTLNISDTPIKEVPNLPNLRHINADYTEVDPEELKKLENLESFSCGKEYFLDDQSEKEIPDGITRVRIYENYYVSRSWDNFDQFPKSVEEIYIGIGAVSDKMEPGSIRRTISHLHRLKKISIYFFSDFDEELYDAIEYFEKNFGRNIEIEEYR